MSAFFRTREQLDALIQEREAVDARIATLEASVRELQSKLNSLESNSAQERGDDGVRLFGRLRVVSGKYWPVHELTDQATVSLLPDFEVGPQTRPEDIPIPGPYPYLRHQEQEADFLQSGCSAAASFKKLLQEDGFRFSTGKRLLDFGCFTGRVLRWFLDEARDGVEVWGVDIHAEAIEWVNRRLCPPFHTATTTTQPHLPFPDGYFDVVYAGSVFTHIADLADAWLLELRRVMAPGGRAYLTFNDEASMALVKARWQGTWDDVMYDKAIGESGRELSEVAFISVGQNPYAAVFYNRQFLIEKLSRLFVFKRVHDGSFGWQSAYLLEKA
jgi:SAM-dependent methyltransferase